MVILSDALKASGEDANQINSVKESEACLCQSILHISDPVVRSLLLLMLKTTTFTQAKSDSLELERVCESLLHMVASSRGREIFNYMALKGCVTNLEIQKNLKISRLAALHHLETLRTVGLVRIYTTLENMTRLSSKYRNAKVWGWVGLPPEYAQEAIKRYLAFFEKTDNVDAREETALVVIMAKVRDGGITQADATDSIKSIYPDARDRVRILDKLKPRILQAGVRWET